MAAGGKQPTKSNRRSTYHHGDLGNAIRTTALMYIAERGSAIFTMRELAAEIGVTHGAVYSHYKNKLAMLEELTLLGLGDLRSMQNAAVEQCQHGLDKLRCLAFAYVEFASTNPGAYRLMFHINDPAEESAEVSMARTGTASNMVLAIGEAQEQGLIVNHPIDVVAFAMWSSCHGLSHLLISDQVTAFEGAATDTHSTIRTSVHGILKGFATAKGDRWLSQID